MASAPSRFVSERIEPIDAMFDTRFMPTGGPGVPLRFRWRKSIIEICDIIGTWTETGPCRNGSPERYVRKHWFDLATNAGETMRVYFERQPRHGQLHARWWLFSVTSSIAD